MKRVLARRTLVAFRGRTVYLATVSATVTADGMSLTVAHFVAVETGVSVTDGMFSASGHVAVIAMIDVEVVIYVAMEAMWAVEPGACSDKDAAIEPFRPIIAVRGAVVGSVVIVSVRTNRRGTDLDGDLGVRFGRADEEERAYCCQQTDVLQ